MRAAAVEAVCAIEGDEAIERVTAGLADAKRPVRVAAAVGLIRHGGVEGAVLGGGRLETLLADPRPAGRMEAAEILRRLGPAGYRPLRRLLEDPEPKVRGAALKAAASAADPRLVPVLLEALASESNRRRASRALAAIGPPALPELMRLLADADTRRAVRLLVPSIAKGIRDERAFDALRALAPPADGQVRLRTFAAMGALRQDLGLKPLPAAEVLARVEAELLDAYRLMASWEAARGSYGTPLLADFVALRLRRCGRRVLRLLELRYPRPEVGLVLRHMTLATQRATALEVLDNLLEPAFKRRVMPFFEDLPPERILAAAGDLAPPPTAPFEFLKRLCQDDNPYAAFVGFQAAVERREAGVLPAALSRLDDAEPLAREGALAAVCALGGEEHRARMAPLARDPDPVVARRAAAWMENREAPMYSTVEKILFLMSVPIFEKLPGEDLAPVARAAEVVTLRDGEVVFQEGEMGDALYVVMRGGVQIRKEGRALAVLGPKEAFGEMAVLEAQKRSADAVAAGETEVLKIGSEEFYEVLREQVEIAEGIIKVLVHRLREADERLHALGGPASPAGTR